MGARLLPPLAAFLFLGLAFGGPKAAHAQEAPAYLALGDSLAFGLGATNPAAEGYVGLVAFALQQSDRYAESGLEVVNVSAPGATSADVLEPDGQLDQALAEIAERAEDDTGGNEVDIISIDVGGNDLLALQEADSPCVDSTSSESCQDALGRTLSGLQDNLTTILTELRDAAPEAPIFVIGLYNPYSGTDDTRELIGNIGVQQVNGVTSAVAADETLGVEFVDVFELFEGRGAQWIASDGIHPNDDGYRVLAEALLAAVQGRPVVLPSDLGASPTAASVTPASGDSDSGGDVDVLVLMILLPLAFVGGVVLSTVYFVARGRR